MNTVCVIMSTYNGERYLNEQIESILQQKNCDLTIHVRDDGSSDKTIGILSMYQEKNRLTFICGKNLGPAESFMEAIFSAPPAKYYALSDQDDIWDPDKVEKAISAIASAEAINQEAVVLYHSALRLMDEYGKTLGIVSGYKNRGFLSGETRSVTGCTAVFNRNLMQLIRRYRPQVLDMHDAWIHRVCLAVDGIVMYDTTPHIGYRQHTNNVIGASNNKFKRYLNRYKAGKHLHHRQKL